MSTFSYPLLVTSACLIMLSACGGNEAPQDPLPSTESTQGQQQSSGPAVDASGEVNPADYQGPQAENVVYYFQTEDGTVTCTLGETYVGCDSEHLPESAGEYADAYGEKGKANAVAMDFGKKAQFQNSTNPVYTYVGSPDAQGGRVLAPETSLTVEDTTCTATTDMGIECTHGDHGFIVSSTQAEVH